MLIFYVFSLVGVKLSEVAHDRFSIESVSSSNVRVDASDNVLPLLDELANVSPSREPVILLFQAI